jgi:hypothetical protein
MNEIRPPTDQLELTGSHLLKYHCAFPKCAGFLQSFATPQDKVKKLENIIFLIF